MAKSITPSSSSVSILTELPQTVPVDFQIPVKSEMGYLENHMGTVVKVSAFRANMARIGDRVITIVGAVYLAGYVITGSGLYLGEAIASSKTFKAMPVIENVACCSNPVIPLFQPATEASSNAAIAAVFGLQKTEYPTPIVSAIWTQ